MSTIRSEVIGVLRGKWRWFLGVGIAMIILGIVAVIMPFSMSLTIEILVGSLLLAGGVLKFIHALKAIKAGGWVWELLASLVYIAAGILLLGFPLQGLITLTALLALFFLINGVFRIIAAVQLRSISTWVWMLMSGIIAFVLGAMIWAKLPSDSLWAIGLIVGIDLIFSGWVLFLFSLKLKKL